MKDKKITGDDLELLFSFVDNLLEAIDEKDKHSAKELNGGLLGFIETLNEKYNEN